ncbi:hypothetical protein FFWV33_14780 [Flavobacterium faecale]|uniref:DUF4890 domain-containing protein n=1 Tax=Flavobacterium faecale TaxID=1355330 RepID=A0A2S1LFY9_9FLAO|nr:hypothetical protein [Flavobacterium faecale]AWG22700.1 hypothetical protein FFWV33_14780 [Flavobacterium faecale]
MKKLLVIAALALCTTAMNAQEKKSLENGAKELNLPIEQVDQLKSMAAERTQKIQDVKKLKLESAEEKAKIQEINKEYWPKTQRILGPEKMKEWNAYWQK